MADCGSLLVSPQTSSKQRYERAQFIHKCVIQCLNNYRARYKPVKWAMCVYDSTVSVTVPLVFFRIQTASSWVTPSKLWPLTAMIWSPRFRRPSSDAAPWNTHLWWSIYNASVLWDLFFIFYRYLAEDGFDVDGKVTMRAAKSTHNTEAQSIRPALQTNALALRRTGRNGDKEHTVAWIIDIIR